MNPVGHIRRLAAVLAAGAIPAFARMVPPPGEAHPGHVAPNSVPPALVPAQIEYRTLVAGGMAEWQSALIAVGVAMLAAAAVLADRALAGRRRAAIAVA